MPNPLSRTTTAQRGRLFGLAVALLAINTVIGIRWQSYLDLHVYRMGARLWLDGESLYGPTPLVDGHALPFTYPPLAAIAFSPFAIIPTAAADALMFALTLAAVGLTLWMVLARLAPRMNLIDRWTVVIGGTAIAEFIEPVRQTLSYGQINAVLMALIAFDILCRHPRWPRGLLIGVAVSIKLTPAGFLLYFLLRRDWRGAATMVAGTVGAVAVAWLVMPADSAKYWFHTLGETGRIGAPYYAGNQSIKGAVFRFGLGEGVSTALWIALSALTVVLAAVWMHRLLAAGQQATALLVNAAAVLLVSPVSWSHHWTWVAPALLVAVYAITTRRFGWPLVATTVLATVVFAVGPHWLLPGGHDAELGWTWWQRIVGDAYVWFTVAVLVVGAVRWRPTAALETADRTPVRAGD
ncbi:glycosyltransferase 87 family protein [Gordonia neofelifaecis]|uniref:glycosyltransferase 87 family protein n=1 Tax=Gordonia neofelifaecis TaxID=945692 RepID=UPI0003035ED5|nr:glycosyltransferase 87 family protein [Gordonia neofelifaecis]